MKTDKQEIPCLGNMPNELGRSRNHREEGDKQEGEVPTRGLPSLPQLRLLSLLHPNGSFPEDMGKCTGKCFTF